MEFPSRTTVKAHLIGIGPAPAVSNNSDLSVAREYHEATKHSEISVRGPGHYLDWESKPAAFKVYRDLPAKPLPTDFPLPSMNALECVGRLDPVEIAERMGVGSLASVFFFAAGITRRLRSSSGDLYTRAASATGALYPIEVYVVCGPLGDLEAGVYHFGPGDFALTRLRRGDFRGYLNRLAGGKRGEVPLAPATIVLTSLAWRNAWKYQARSYRHWFWDSGVIASNLLATCISLGFRARLLMGFDDSQVGALLGLEEGKEAPVALAPIGMGVSKAETVEMGGGEPEPIAPAYLPLSKEEVDYPIIWKTNGASSLSGSEVEGWTRPPVRTGSQRGAFPKSFTIEPEFTEPSLPPGLGEVILKRGSTRRFARRPIMFRQLSTVLHCSTRGIPTDFLDPGDSLIETYLIANSVEGLPPGTYHFDRASGALDQLKAGTFRDAASFLCLEQPLFGDASVTLFLMADLKPVLSSLGNRGYRAAQFEAGAVAGKVYLSAYAQGMGASGSTFYDDYVTEFFAPHAAGKSPMIAVGVGIPAYDARPGKILAGKLRHEDVLRA